MPRNKGEQVGRAVPSAPPVVAPGSGAVRIPRPATSSAFLDTRVSYCGENLEQLQKLPDAGIDLISIDPPFNPNRNDEVACGETRVKRAYEDRHASTRSTASTSEIAPVRCSVHR